jgi:uncharacterized protein (DUF934 family)
MRRVLRQRDIVVDDWRHANGSDAGAASALIFPLARWQAERELWRPGQLRLGVRLGAADPVDALVADFDRLALIAIEFGGIGEGRGYSQARLLRGRYRFAGALRAVGNVAQDQVVFLARCGFDEFEIASEVELELARAALDRYSVAYQRADARLVRPHTRRSVVCSP